MENMANFLHPFWGHPITERFSDSGRGLTRDSALDMHDGGSAPRSLLCMDVLRARHVCSASYYLIIIIIITTTMFIVLSSTAPAICESSLWFLWAKVGQRQVHGRQLVGQAANLTFESACRLL